MKKLICVINYYKHRSILNMDLEIIEKDPIYLGVSYFYVKVLNVHKKLHLKHFDPFSVWQIWVNMDFLITFHLVLLLAFYYLIN